MQKPWWFGQGRKIAKDRSPKLCKVCAIISDDGLGVVSLKKRAKTICILF